MPSRNAGLVISIAVVLAFGASAPAQCAGWLPGEVWPGAYGGDGVFGNFRAFASWDPDGAGPLPTVLVAGGRCIAAGGRSAANIATWDGANWQPMGAGAGTTFDHVLALAAFNGEVIAGGDFSTAGGASASRIARWNGSTWQPLGSGITGGAVDALAVFNGQLIAGGSFAAAGGVSAGNIARWDGSVWQPLGTGASGTVMALEVYNGELIAGGLFSTVGGVSAGNIARWDGTIWRTLGTGVNGVVSALAPFNGALIAGGSFTTAGGAAASKVASWDGAAWHPLSGGITGLQVNALASNNGELLAGGVFTSAGGVNTGPLARWDGSAWHAAGAGVRVTPQSQLGSPTVYALAPFNNEVVAGGLFDIAGELGVAGAARWTGSAWGALGGGISDEVGPAATYNGQLVIGGWFLGVGSTPAHWIASWDGVAWQPLGSGLSGGAGATGSPTGSFVHALCPFRGGLAAGGNFSVAGGASASNIALWDGSSWHPLGTGLALNGNALGASAYAMAVYNDRLIVGGAFTTAGTLTALGLASWDGTAWHSLGILSPSVTALTVFDGQLIAGGPFTSAGGTPANHIAAWDGSSWHALGAGVTFGAGGGYGSTLLAVYNNRLVAATSTGVRAWDGTNWQPLGTGMTSPVFSLCVYHGSLIAVLANGGALRRWDGSVWQPMTGPAVFPNWVDSAMAYNDELVVTGYFDHADTVPAACVARWSDTHQPWIAVEPSALVLTTPGSNIALAVTVASGYGPLTYQWRKDQVPLTDGPTPTGSTVSGATTGTLNISTIALADGGRYDVVVSNSCASVTSTGSAVLFCYANCDASTAPPILNISDFICFQSAFAAGSGYANCDGSTTPPVLNISDFICFQGQFAAGCP